MSLTPLVFGAPQYSPEFSISPGDLGVVKLRSRESSKLSHESLDENFANLATKINDIITEIGTITGGDNAPIEVNVSQINGLSAGTGLDYLNGTFSHESLTAAPTGYTSTNQAITKSSLKYVNDLSFDSLGHVTGYNLEQVSFTGTGGISVSTTDGAVTISGTQYVSENSSPDFNNIKCNQLDIVDAEGVSKVTISSISEFAPVDHAHKYSEITNKPTTFTPPVASSDTLGGVMLEYDAANKILNIKTQ